MDILFTIFQFLIGHSVGSDDSKLFSTEMLKTLESTSMILSPTSEGALLSQFLI